jgi:hypothetical protein
MTHLFKCETASGRIIAFPLEAIIAVEARSDNSKTCSVYLPGIDEPFGLDIEFTVLLKGWVAALEDRFPAQEKLS